MEFKPQGYVLQAICGVQPFCNATNKSFENVANFKCLEVT